jgi:hypothetical protein
MALVTAYLKMEAGFSQRTLTRSYPVTQKLMMRVFTAAATPIFPFRDSTLTNSSNLKDVRLRLQQRYVSILQFYGM